MQSEVTSIIKTDEEGFSFCELRQCRVRLLERGIVENHFFDNALIEVDDIRDARGVNEQFCPDIKYAILLNMGNNVLISDEARALSASEEFGRHVCGRALLVPDAISKMIAELYRHQSNPVAPTRVFSDREKAIRWLREQLAST